MPASPNIVSGLVQIACNTIATHEDQDAVRQDRHVRRHVASGARRAGGAEGIRARPVGKMIRAPAFRHESESEKKLTIAPSAIGTWKKLTL